jgi:hypothetical protein
MEYAAPTGLGNFWFVFLQRCRAYGAGKSVAAVTDIQKLKRQLLLNSIG